VNGASVTVLGRVRTYASLVRFSHSVFALPFALLSLLAASDGRPAPRTLVLVVAAVVAARTAAMAYNRFADRDVDAVNPRTAQREIPRGAVSPRAALLLTTVAGAAFLASCVALGPACAWLGAPTLAWLLAYSHVKRFSAACHAWLGIALGIAPVAAWLAVDGGFGARMLAPAVLGAAVAAWVGGFDIAYACQDEAFDRTHGLRSLPARLGALGALRVARALHALAFAGFVAFGLLVPLGAVYLAGTTAAAGMLLWQHRLLRGGDLRRIDAAFFTANGAIAVLMFAAGAVDLYVRG
jgi:4-hydroxybenzoate polyprenyltransferase